MSVANGKTECPADIVVTLVNESKFYKAIIPMLKSFRTQTRGAHYADIRQFIFTSIRTYHERTWSSNDARCTSAVVDGIYIHYFEEISGGSQFYDTQGFWENEYLNLLQGYAVEDYKKRVKALSDSKDLPVNHYAMEDYEKRVKALSDKLVNNWRDTHSEITAVWTDRVSNFKQPTKEKQMKIETGITLVNDVNATSLTDDQIFQHIKAEEAMLNALSTMQASSKKMEAKKQAIKDNIAALVAIVDSRP